MLRRTQSPVSTFSRSRAPQYNIDGEEVHLPTRPVDKDKAEQELTINIKKATNSDETAPKQKHVRKCIVYTWDYHSSVSIWQGLRVQPILSDEVQTFKALITVHKILQEGHPVTLKEAQGQTGWLETCARTVGNDSARGYGPLIRTYVAFILAKLRFHRQRREFNGLFEYKEYISLKEIDDPNEGYETISDLMGLQDQIDAFQRIIFSHFNYSSNNECRISALVPLVKESWNIYRFITSMLRAMHRRTDSVDALEPLRSRYTAQHHALRKFYYECSNLKYLTGLINVPKLGQEPPNLFESDDGAPALPARPEATNNRALDVKSPPPAAPTPTPTAAEIEEQGRILAQYEAQQKQLVAQREAEEQMRREQEAAQQREYEELQRQQAERERLAREQVLQNQFQAYSTQAAQQLMELQQQMVAMQGQYERDQLLLEQYDRRVKGLESELAAINTNVAGQMMSKDELIKQLQDQVALWRNKYESLAKLYSQLRTEHLEMLSKYKQLQLKANSAQEAIDKMERMERDVKAKNLELATMIKERDRARFDLDRQTANHRDEIERLRRDLSFANERAEDASRGKSEQTASLISKYNRQLNELEDSLRAKQIQIDDLLQKLDGSGGDLDRLREEKDQEIQILQEAMDSTIQQLHELQQTQGFTDQANTAQIDTLILDNRKKLNEIIDSILQSCVQKVDEGIYELESPGQAGNQSATPEYTLSMIEKAMNTSNEFATTFTLYVNQEPGGEHVEVIKSANSFAQVVSDVLITAKGVTRLTSDDDASDRLVAVAKKAGDTVLRFFLNLQSYRIDFLQPQQRSEVAVRNNVEARGALQKLSEIVEVLVPKNKAGSLAKANGDIGDIVEQEMLSAARAIEAATQRLKDIMAQPRDTTRFNAIDVQVHDTILASALAIANAISRLIKAATESQQEIVTQGKGTSSTHQFYKKNSRWTEGLISAAKAVAFATNLLIECADGVLSGTHTLEQLIVASNEVASATAQLVAASRVKASLMSKTQEKLELAAKAVTEACKALVRQVKEITAKQIDADQFDFSALGAHEFKVREMEQQVEILRLEKELGAARHTLGQMRRAGYHTDERDVQQERGMQRECEDLMQVGTILT
ncbi:hypothetical protein Clacol_008911 [Clathrus columnatus]|uniref:Cytoskeleton assembly control protein n=1 Tax=Clathrus columnatus TaxID=1419009 RepID=A0AAV5AP84_9AGAM|nr:hypothetical protein Clacol_008911 [Clathrus columnatus]